MSGVAQKQAAPLDPAREAAIGVALAALIVSSWLALHVYGVFFHRWTALGVALAPVLIALQCWLNVGLFIIAHDCMHGSFAPFRPRVNRAVGRLCLALYAAFSYDRLLPSHMAHHRHAGTPLDPDFHAEEPRAFWPWFAVFMKRYFGWREFAGIATVVTIYIVVLGAQIGNVLALFALPAILSAMQLFYFGTYLPHRHEEEEEFRDDHRARSSGFGWLASLLTCFHFGYHHEHHARPSVPWWRLPEIRGRT